ncbi:MAG: LysM domain-containing protein [Tissierellaceae bacterium]|nr:LysM domain-containing protein [Tissierellaceae bacterium]
MMGNKDLKSKLFKRRELTKSEKTLIGLLGAVIIIWLVYRFIYIPQTEKLQLLSEQKIEYEAKIAEINNTLRKEKKINEDWDLLRKERDAIVARYFPRLDQAQIIYLLNNLVEDENIYMKDFNFNRPSFENISDFEVKNMGISIPYSGNYMGVIDVINRLKESPRRILVDNITMDLGSDGELNGNMALRIYSLEGIAEADDKVIYIDVAEGTKDTPFARPESISDSTGLEDSEDGGDLKPYVEEILHDFENRNVYFIPSHRNIKGSVGISTNSKSKNYSLKWEYNILAVEEENMAYADVSRTNINLKYPPNSIGLWIYAYDYSPAAIGIVFKGQMGEEILLPFIDGIGWTGWKYVELSPPGDIDLYPLNIEKLYLEIPKDRDNYGIVLVDKLEAVYNRNMDEDGEDRSVSTKYIFHNVEEGESIESISREYYGTDSYMNEILKLNEMKAGDILPVGKVLVLKRR